MKKDKNKDKDKDAQNNEPPKVLQVHDLSGRVPTMSDPELVSLLANGRRLLAVGNAMRKKMAEGLVPLVEEEVAKRIAAKDEAKKAAASKRTKKGAAAAAAAEAAAAAASQGDEPAQS